MAQAPAATREDIRPVKRVWEDALLAHPGVVGVDIAEKVSGGVATGRLAIVVHVEVKRDLAEVGPGEAIPAEIEGVPTDVVVHHVGLEPVAVDPAFPDRVRPLAGGVSFGPLDPVTVADEGSAAVRSVNGTLGLLVTEPGTGRSLALTNWHVAAGDGVEDVGSAWAQPALADEGAPRDRVGVLARGVLTERVDAAVVALAPGVPWVPGIVGIGPVTGWADAQIGTRVRKHGRTTGLTAGVVASVDFTTVVDFGPGTGRRTLRDQLRVEPSGSDRFSAGGDSGSVLVDDDGRVVGLHWSGEDDGSFAVASPIRVVLGTLGVQVATPATVRAARARRQATAWQVAAIRRASLLPPVSAAYAMPELWRAAGFGGGAGSSEDGQADSAPGCRVQRGASRLVFCPFQAANAASSEPYFRLSQSAKSFSKMRNWASGMFLASKVQKKNESSFCNSTPNSAGSSVNTLPVASLGVVRSVCHHERYFSWNFGLNRSAANGCVLPS